ncbi:MAG: hypothetical protein AAB368_03510, partial [bacterium]
MPPQTPFLYRRPGAKLEGLDEPAIAPLWNTIFPPPPEGGFKQEEYQGVPSREAVKGAAAGDIEAAKAAQERERQKTAEKQRLQAGAAAVATKEAVNPGATGEKAAPPPPSSERQYPFDTVTTPDGKVVIATPDRAEALAAGGATYRKPGEPMPFGGIPGGEARKFLSAAGREATPEQMERSASGLPYSEQLRSFASQGYRGEAPAEGKWTFRGGYPETGKAGPREGKGDLSRTEQEQARREWLERRVREEQASEMGDIEHQVKRAQADYQLRQAKVDPLALARILAEGKYGGDVLRYRTEAASRE